MKEIEVRSFISAEVYSACRRILDAQATLVESTRQITHYLDSEVDTRIQLSTSGGRMWQKKGKMHDPSKSSQEQPLHNQDTPSYETSIHFQ